MPDFIKRPEGNFKFIAGHGTYCQDVLPLPGYTLEQAIFVSPKPLKAAFAAIQKHLAAIGRPVTALCGAELRIPQALSFDGFGAFNTGYVALLDKYGLRHAGPNGPLGTMTRTNVATEPVAAKPTEPSVFGFTYTIPGRRAGGRKSFLCAGSGELAGSGRSDIIALGDLSPAGLLKKADWVMNVFDTRIPALGASWADATHINLYCVHSPDSYLEKAVLRRIGAAAHIGLHWHITRPPIVELEFEADVKGVNSVVYL